MLLNSIYFYRIKKNLSQTQLAKLANCFRNTISSLENYQYGASADLALRLCNALNCKFEDLFFSADEVVSK